MNGKKVKLNSANALKFKLNNSVSLKMCKPLKKEKNVADKSLGFFFFITRKTLWRTGVTKNIILKKNTKKGMQIANMI